MTRPWPAADPRAFSGLAGQLVRVIDPATEADTMAVLAQLLVAVGNALGRSACFMVEDTAHYLNLMTIIVGETAKARKGTAWHRVERIMALADDTWVRDRVASGLSSGEGLIYHVRDPVFKQKPQRENGQIIGYEDVLEDPGVADKRLLALESEFAGPLRVMKREGSTLSQVIRAAWDGSPLRTLTRNSPLQATGAHVSIIGHITDEELRRELSHTDYANGFLNRFLLVCARRSKCLPDGGTVDDAELIPLARALTVAINFGRSVGALTRTPEARDAWHTIYPSLSDGRPGLLGAATSRAEAQVTRLSALFAVLDMNDMIRLPHHEAALAVWDYCLQSATYVLGDSSGDPVADRILSALKTNPPGLPREAIRELFSRNRSAQEIDRALRLLQAQGRAKVSRVLTGGRPAEVWEYTA